MANYDTMTRSLAACLGAQNTPVILWGPPGQGKTSVITALAEQLGWHLTVVLASIREPSDFAGLPNVVHGRTELIAPGWAQDIAARSRAGQRSILFLDEVSTAPPATQAALLRVVLDKTVGDLYLGDDVVIVAAANPPEQAADGWDLAPPMANRFVHLDWELPSAVVQQGLSLAWPEVVVPVVSEKAVAKETQKARIVISSFLSARTDYTTVIPKSSSDAGRAFPTPRSWEMVSRLYGYVMAAHGDDGVLQAVVRGTVGPAAAGEFLSYVSNLDLPNAEDILKSPTGWEIPSRGDKVYAIASSVYYAVKDDNSESRWHACGAFLGYLSRNGHADLAVTFAREWATTLRISPQWMWDTASLKELSTILELKELIEKDQ